MRPITLLPLAALIEVGVTVLARKVVGRRHATGRALIAHVDFTALDRDHVLYCPAELLGANDAKARVEQAVAKEAVLLVLRVGLDGTGGRGTSRGLRAAAMRPTRCGARRGGVSTWA